MSRYATRSRSKPVITGEVQCNPILFKYPSDVGADTAEGVVTFTEYDLGQMRPQMYLNDTIISFFIQYYLDTKVDQKIKGNIYVFNTFFYPKIRSIKAKQIGESASFGFASKWLKGVEIFNKDFLIMPVCEHDHWFLVIICYPSRQSHGNKYLFIEDKDLYEPAVFVLNSSSHTFAPKVKKSLSQFLRYQWKVEKGSERSFPINNAKRHGIRLIFPDVPQQRNNYNCGVYILNYFYCFLNDPRISYLKMIRGRDQKKWFEENDINISRERVRMRDTVAKQARLWRDQDRNNTASRVKQDSQDIHIESVSNSSSSSIDISVTTSSGPVITIH